MKKLLFILGGVYLAGAVLGYAMAMGDSAQRLKVALRWPLSFLQRFGILPQPTVGTLISEPAALATPPAAPSVPAPDPGRDTATA